MEPRQSLVGERRPSDRLAGPRPTPDRGECRDARRLAVEFCATPPGSRPAEPCPVRPHPTPRADGRSSSSLALASSVSRRPCPTTTRSPIAGRPRVRDQAVPGPVRQLRRKRSSSVRPSTPVRPISRAGTTRACHSAPGRRAGVLLRRSAGRRRPGVLENPRPSGSITIHRDRSLARPDAGDQLIRWPGSRSQRRAWIPSQPSAAIPPGPAA